MHPRTDTAKLGALLVVYHQKYARDLQAQKEAGIIGTTLSGALKALTLLGMAQVGWEGLKSAKRGFDAAGKGDWKRAGTHALRSGINIGTGVLLGGGFGHAGNVASGAPWWKPFLKGVGSTAAMIGLPVAADALTAKVDPKFFAKDDLRAQVGRSAASGGSSISRYIPWASKAIL